MLNHGVYPSSNAAQFATAWFNPTENRLPIYGSVEAGLAVNFVGPLIYIVIAEYYSRNLQRTVTKRFVSIDSIFVFSVLATYTYTYLYCLINHVVGTGTSIVAFCLLLSFSAIALVDLTDKDYRSRLQKEILTLIVWFIAGIGFPVLAVWSYVIGNPDSINHFGGLCCFLVFIGSLLLIRLIRIQSNKDSVSSA